MTRIIAGFAGSLTIAVPGQGTRPTSDRVREAIFSALESRDLVDGARVIDLYAGSGALGLEAASRGASHVTLVEKSAAAASVCRRNAAVVLKSAPAGSEPVIEVAGRSVQSFLAGSNALWDVALIDPPYELDETELSQGLARLASRLTPDAAVVLERSSRSPEPAWPVGLEPQRRKDYGDTTLWWARASSG
ncbi:MAG: rsmD [Microbacteriaceae bacterium]|nr:rsmD [Microbacteriaceae bacterium]HEV7955585.1 16S rRNA (guanine(966)-N(2))-methyltransferase RsmD [Marisediminicola sp.]